MMALTIVCCLTAFVVGGIPFGYLVGHLILKDDIRKHGSGNIGATNVGRVIGWKWGSIVLILDAIKGLTPTLGAKILLLSRPDSNSDFVLFATIATGISAILGHMYPIWLRLRGGKGVATALGVVLVISPKASLVALGCFLLVVAATKIVALASIAASISFAVTQLIILGTTAVEIGKLPLTLFSIVVPGLIIWRHQSNIARMWQGKENKIAKNADSRRSAESDTPE